MKQFFDYNFSVRNVWHVWIISWFLWLAPIVIYYSIAYSNAYNFQHAMVVGVSWGEGMSWLLPFWIVASLVAILLSIVWVRYLIQSLSLSGEKFVFKTRIGDFLILALKGFLMSLVTLGIYLPWFISDLYEFFARSTTYKSTQLDFFGMGRILFGRILITSIIPAIVVLILTNELYIENDLYAPASFEFGTTSVLILMSFIGTYLIYKWRVDIKYKFFIISWKTQLIPAAGTFVIHLLLSVITLGLYAPFAFIKLYEYCANNTVAEYDNDRRKFGYQAGETTKDYVFVLIQFVLIAVTVGLYLPWAWSAIGKRFIGRTYVYSAAK